MQSFHSQGKLLITAEYLVLDGAKALALPTKLGQSLEVSETDSKGITWKSFTNESVIWEEVHINQIYDSNDAIDFTSEKRNEFSERLIQIFRVLSRLNPTHFETEKGFEFVTRLEFPRNWGLGSSSTLINNLAQWADVDPYELLESTFGGSGYDIACADSNTAIHYQILNGKPVIESSSFDPSFKDHLYFVHLNRKQNSREAIKHYRKQTIDSENIDFFSKLTKDISNSNSLKEFMELIELHEIKLSQILDQPRVKDLYFDDFEGSIKSLGGWGGDFIMVASFSSPKTYFQNKGYDTILTYSEMVF